MFIGNRIKEKLLKLFFSMAVLVHLYERIYQLGEYYWLDKPKEEALGLLGSGFSTLFNNELLHFSFVLFGWVFLYYWRNESRLWKYTYYFQCWRLFERTLVLIQILIGVENPNTLLNRILNSAIPGNYLYFFYTLVTSLLVTACLIEDYMKYRQYLYEKRKDINE